MLKTTRRDSFKLLGLPIVLAAAPLGAAAQGSSGSLHSAKVFTISNHAAGNAVLVFGADKGGSLEMVASAPTQGLGSGGGLGSQGALTLDGSGQYVFAVNAGSHTVSALRLGAHGLQFVSVVASGGVRPISVTERHDVVVVLNDGGGAGAGNITAFRNRRGQLTPIAGATRPLSANAFTAPAQVSFSADGNTLIVTEKGTHRLVGYEADDDGHIGAPQVTPSAGMVPFGFAFDQRNRLFVSEASGSASSYALDGTAAQVLSAAVPTTQGAPCWVAVTQNGRYMYTSNTASDSISSFRVARDGRITLIAAVAAAVGANSTPVDSAISNGGQHLFLLDRGNLRIVAYAIAPDGSLNETGSSGNASLPASVVGLAAN